MGHKNCILLRVIPRGKYLGNKSRKCQAHLLCVISGCTPCGCDYTYLFGLLLCTLGTKEHPPPFRQPMSSNEGLLFFLLKAKNRFYVLPNEPINHKSVLLLYLIPIDLWSQIGKLILTPDRNCKCKSLSLKVTTYLDFILVVLEK